MAIALGVLHGEGVVILCHLFQLGFGISAGAIAVNYALLEDVQGSVEVEPDAENTVYQWSGEGNLGKLLELSREVVGNGYGDGLGIWFFRGEPLYAQRSV
jgi:hypothetical protein